MSGATPQVQTGDAEGCESPAAPVFVDGKKSVTLRGDNIANEFRAIVDDYVESHYEPRS